LRNSFRPLALAAAVDDEEQVLRLTQGDLPAADPANPRSGIYSRSRVLLR